MGNILQKKMYPLSNPQKRIWYVEQNHPYTSLFCLGGVVKFNGNIDFSIMEQSINKCLRENDTLRIRISSNSAEQYIEEFQIVQFEQLDFSLSEHNLFNTWANQKFRTPFVFEKSPLIEFSFFKLKNNESGYLIKVHHIILDGWSISLLTARIYEQYQKITRRQEIDSQKYPSYISFVKEEDLYLRSSAADNDRNFWIKKFANLNEESLTNINEIRKGSRAHFLLESSKVSQLRIYLAKNNISFNVYYSALMILYQYKISNMTDITIGIPVANRTNKSNKLTMGMFTSTMPLRIMLSKDISFLQLLSQINKELRSCYAHQKYPYNSLIQDLELGKIGYNNLFKICINYYNTKHAIFLDEMSVENNELYNGYQYYPLQIIIKEWVDDEVLQLQFDYDNIEYDLDKIDQIKNCFDHITDQVISHDEILLSAITILSKESSNVLTQRYNDVPAIPDLKGRTVLSLFQDQLFNNKNRIAISGYNGQLTYEEFNQKIEQVAVYITTNNIPPGSNICVISDRTIDYVITIWGILKAGCCFVPLDPNIAAERKKYIITHTAPAAIIINSPNKSTFDGYRYIDFEEILNTVIENEDLSFPTIDSNSIAYIIFTSGSTGNPKGVMVQHSNLTSYIAWAALNYLDSKDDIFAFYSSIGFDLTITSLFAPLVKGAQIRVFHDTGSENIILDIIAENKTTVLKLTPGHLSLISDQKYLDSLLKVLIVGGDSFSTDLAKKIDNNFNNKVSIYNEYGPTEATVGCMIYLYTQEDKMLSTVPIGKPISGTQIYILNEDLQPLPIGISGEIYIGGGNVSKGYFNDSTNSSYFLPNPFKKGEKFYRTGDFAMFLDQERIIYQGRKDSQVKIRGYRIELFEIERAILTYTVIKETVVTTENNNTDGKLLVAYIVSDSPIDIVELKQYLGLYLPEYMIPNFFLILPKLPLNHNGKVDKRILTDHFAAHSKILLTENTDFPTKFQQEIINLLQSVLQIQNITLNDNFYFIGGDSIKAIQFSSKLAEKGFSIKVQDILSQAVIRKIIGEIKVRKHIDQLPEKCEGVVEPGPAMHWFLNQKFTSAEYYSQSVLLNLKIDVDIKILEKVFECLVKHHDSLRIQYDKITNTLFYNNNISNKFIIKEYDLSNTPDNLLESEIKNIGIEIKSSLTFGLELLFKICLIKLANGKKMILIVAHHILIDGVSIRILLEDISTLLNKHLNDSSQQLPFKSNSFKKWAEQFKKDYCYIPDTTEIDYWKSYISSDYKQSYFHFYQQKSIDGHRGNQVIKKVINGDLTSQLLNVHQIYNTSTSDILLIAIALSVSKICNTSKILFELEGHGRGNLFSEEIDINRTVGWFTQFTIMPISINKGNLDTQIKSIKEQLRNPVFSNPRYAVLRDVYKSVEQLHGIIRFNYLGDFDNVASKVFFDISKYETGPDIAANNKLDCLLEINSYIINGCLEISLKYDTEHLNKDEVWEFMTLIILHINDIIKYITDKDGPEFSPSDFSMVTILQSEIDSLFN